ncbi:MAG TPA: AMP-binding protein [Candidatus Baltobacteraceae bacterium]|jgi:2-aminobenzoate-CoA ligase|nr:AMP-binding protein [Candidatus Baltobacteraceae bacterium]
MHSAHIDRFAAERLPPMEQWPELLFSLDGLKYGERMNCASLLLDRDNAPDAGSRRCIVGSGITWTYDELRSHANRIARVLVDDLGVVPGNRVLLRGFNSPMLAASWLGVMKAGAIAVTTMPLYRAIELRTVADRAAVTHALCEARLGDEWRSAMSDRPDVRTLYFGEGDLEDRMLARTDTFENVDTYATDVAMIAFTSGTTGRPKAAAHFHRDIMAVCDTYGRYVLQANCEDLFTGSPPLAFTFGLGGLLLFPLHIGAASLLLERAQPELLLAAIAQHRASVLFTAPVAYRAMAEQLGRYDASSLRICVSAGETLPLPVWQTWYERTGIKILDGIGSTEMLHIFIGSPREEAIGGSTGRAVPGYIAQIHDDQGRPVPSGTVGRLAVKGPTGCRYLDDDRQTTYVQNGWNYPGDAYRMDDGGYFWYVARTDDMIISSGYNISGPEVEQVLLEHADVKECAVVGKPDPARDTNIVKAYVVLKAGVEANAAKAEELQTFVRDRVAPFKTPREVEFVDELPRTETGKVQRFRLRARAALPING